jgi:hypothetical protein
MTTESTSALAELMRQLADIPDDGHQYEVVHNRLVRMPRLSTTPARWACGSAICWPAR